MRRESNRRCRTQEIGLTPEVEIKFSRRIGEKLERVEARPLLVGFDSVHTTEAILDRSYRLSMSTHDGLREVTIVRDLERMNRKSWLKLRRKT